VTGEGPIVGAAPEGRRMKGTTTIVLADDHAVVRQGLRALLDVEPGFSVVGEAADGLIAMRLVEQLRPLVLVVDLMMPGLGGLDVTRQVTRKARSRTRVVILSMHASEAYLLEALRNGASAYVLKDASSTELNQAIREAAAGRRYLSSPFSDTTIEAYLRKAKDAASDPYESLTRREREIFHLAAEGLSSVETAERLFISRRTVDTHRARILRKLGLRSQAEIVRYALGRGILRLDDSRQLARRPRGRLPKEAEPKQLKS